MQAARLLAALAAAQPSSAASLLRTAAEDLRQATAQMASLAAPYGAKHSLPSSAVSRSRIRVTHSSCPDQLPA